MQHHAGSPVSCQERERLFHEHNKALVDAAQASRRLSDLAGTASQGDFELLRREKIRAVERVRRVRALYERHLERHGCASATHRTV